jgi:predicted RNA binding protein YcfA (HicA-like mRNA interferase family)
MPRKIRQLIADLTKAGFLLDRQKGSHRQFTHPELTGVITVSGGEGEDARRYQEKQVATAVAQVNKRD